MRTQSAAADWMGANRLLQACADLREDWDGYGAAQIEHETISNARGVLLPMLEHIPLPEVTPNSNGTISLEWEAERGYAQLEVGKTKFGFFLRPKDPNLKPDYSQGFVSEFPPTLFAELIRARLFSFAFGNLSVTDFRFADV